MDLKKELEVLKQQKNKVLADYNAVIGAIQFCEMMIKKQGEEQLRENKDRELQDKKD